MTTRGDGAQSPDGRIATRALLTNTTFELIPMKSAAEKARSIPAGTRVSVTASPAKDMAATVDLAEQLTAFGLEVIPHISARLTKSHAELDEIVSRLDGIGTREVFVVGGDATDPGEFFDAMALIERLVAIDHPFERIGVTGYPEGHPHISDEALMGALIDKLPYAAYVTTQMCFDPTAIERWVTTIRARGIDLPVVVGVPGVTDITKLMGISAQIGVGTSLRFLAKNRSLATRLLKPYSPDELVESVGRIAAEDSMGVTGIHVYTFNQVETTMAWFRAATT